MMPPYLLAAPLLAALFVLASWLRRLRARSIAFLPGPPPGSWLVGNTPALFRPKEVGEADFAWMREYGNAVCIKGTFGREMLFITDPKALQYILNTSAYHFAKPPENRANTSLTIGKGIVWAEGSLCCRTCARADSFNSVGMQHSRHRKIMNPAFSYGALRGFLPLFHHTAQKTVSKLKEYVRETGRSSAVVDVPTWLARTTLDAIGIAAFDYQFGALDQGSDNELANAYKNLFVDTNLNRSDFNLAYDAFIGLLPQWLVALAQRAPIKRLRRFRSLMKISRGVAQRLVDRQMASPAEGKDGAKDVMSILIKANLSEDPKTKLDNEEILAQLTTLFLAGHETTASTTSWALYELSRHPDFQAKVREEIKATRAEAARRGDHELSVADLDSMTYLLGLMKETLRYHPIVSGIMRLAGRDEVIPLSTPQKTRTEGTITNIPVSKGQRIFISISGYNRLKSLWGDDADQWRPERFVEGVMGSQKAGVGVIANIATFSSGLRSCIGWRFALLEMQAILIELIENLEFSPPPGNIEIIRAATGITSPMIKGSDSRRAELPITITPISS
ncbi:cytochrome P450 [Gautieria morchelliformis]|nr:cytochrome P450 [Gautieria morchelliformis]